MLAGVLLRQWHDNRAAWHGNHQCLVQSMTDGKSEQSENSELIPGPGNIPINENLTPSNYFPDHSQNSPIQSSPIHHMRSQCNRGPLMETISDCGQGKYKVQFATCTECNPTILASVEDDKPNLKNALSGPNAEQWQTAMDTEVTQSQNLNWSLYPQIGKSLVLMGPNNKVQQ